MALSSSYVLVYGQLGEVFQRIADGQAPDKFTTQYLKDLGFSSSNFRAVIPLLKSLGFLTADGSPTQRYHDYRNSAHSKKVIAEALRETYGDLFTIKANPTTADRELIEGKFKSAHNSSPNTAKLMASTFYSLLELADMSATIEKKPEVPVTTSIPGTAQVSEPLTSAGAAAGHHRPALHYNIQIHLPATKDIEVFNSIFKALREHLLE